MPPDCLILFCYRCSWFNMLPCQRLNPRPGCFCTVPTLSVRILWAEWTQQVICQGRSSVTSFRDVSQLEANPVTAGPRARHQSSQLNLEQLPRPVCLCDALVAGNHTQTHRVSSDLEAVMTLKSLDVQVQFVLFKRLDLFYVYLIPMKLHKYWIEPSI